MVKNSDNTPNSTNKPTSNANQSSNIAYKANISITPSQSEIFKAIGNFLLYTLPDNFQILQGQLNRTATPLTPFVTMTLTKRERISTNDKKLMDNGNYHISQPAHITVAIHLFGDKASDGAACLETLFRDSYSTEWFQNNAQQLIPLYSSEITQIPLQSAEDQYEAHWMLELHFQLMTTITFTQESATSLHIQPFYEP